jgi:ABC-type transport system involved in multi-copper enzyme maturation permease subunit
MFGYQHSLGKFLIFFLAIGLALLISESLGLLFAMITPTADLAIIILSIVLIVALSLTGFLTLGMPKYYSWFEHINYMRCAAGLPLLCCQV